MEVANPDNVWLIDHGIANPLAFGHASYITDATGAISDVFGVAIDPVSGAVIGVAFMSPPDGHPLDLVVAQAHFGLFATWINLGTETGGTYDITGYLAAGNTGTFQSDVEPVPDGGSAVALLGIALAAVEGARRVLGSRKA